MMAHFLSIAISLLTDTTPPEMQAIKVGQCPDFSLLKKSTL
jgi:hypothetical protein